MQALTIRQEIGDRTGEATTLHNIAALYQSQGRYSEALDLYVQALVSQQEVGDQAGQ